MFCVADGVMRVMNRTAALKEVREQLSEAGGIGKTGSSRRRVSGSGLCVDSGRFAQHNDEQAGIKPSPSYSSLFGIAPPNPVERFHKPLEK